MPSIVKLLKLFILSKPIFQSTNSIFQSKRLVFSKFVIFMLMGLLSGATLASVETVPVTVKLTEIKAIKTSETKGDELYLHTTKYSNLVVSEENRLPIFPEHWPSKQLNKVKDVVIWKGKLKEGESIKLIISLLDEDLPPWDADDLLGSAQLKLSNQQGKLKTEWMVPVFEETEEVEMLKPASPQHYLFKGAGSLYDVAFQVE